MKTCSIDSCENPIKAKGLCDKHYARQMRHGTVDDEEIRSIRKMKRKKCVTLGCDELVKSYGFCNKHYKRFKEHGSPFIPKCGYEKCNKLKFQKGLCKEHYFEWEKYIKENTPSSQHDYYLSQVNEN